MSRWSTRKAQIEPLAAIVAVFAVCAGLTAYASVLDAAVGGPAERNVAEPTLERVQHAVSAGGVVRPRALPSGLDAGPDGYSVNLTVTTDTAEWDAGPDRPPAADVDSRIVSVRLGPSRIRSGRLTVAVWR